jgi:hypothetical protein
MINFIKKHLNTGLALITMVLVAIVVAQIEMQSGLGIAMAIAVYTKACTKNVGGNTFIAVAEVASMTSFTVTAGEITAVTPNGVNRFHKADATIDTIVRTEEGAGNGNNIAYTHRIEIKTTKPSVALNTWRSSLADASPCGILAITADGNGTCWLTGYSIAEGFKRPLRLVSDSFTSGATPGDEAGQTVTIGLECVTGYVDIPFNSALSASIIAGTATAFITYS